MLDFTVKSILRPDFYTHLHRGSKGAIENEDEARELAFSRERVRSYLKDKEVNRVIYVPKRLVNIVLN